MAGIRRHLELLAPSPQLEPTNENVSPASTWSDESSSPLPTEVLYPGITFYNLVKGNYYSLLKTRCKSPKSVSCIAGSYLGKYKGKKFVRGVWPDTDAIFAIFTNNGSRIRVKIEPLTRFKLSPPRELLAEQKASQIPAQFNPREELPPPEEFGGRKGKRKSKRRRMNNKKQKYTKKRFNKNKKRFNKK